MCANPLFVCLFDMRWQMKILAGPFGSLLLEPKAVHTCKLLGIALSADASVLFERVDDAIGWSHFLVSCHSSSSAKASDCAMRRFMSELLVLIQWRTVLPLANPSPMKTVYLLDTTLSQQQNVAASPRSAMHPDYPIQMRNELPDGGELEHCH